MLTKPSLLFLGTPVIFSFLLHFAATPAYLLENDLELYSEASL